MSIHFIMTKMFHLEKEPQFQFNDKRRSIKEAKEWAKQEYGDHRTIETLNITSIDDDCDVFVLGRPID
jgi:hypothetical protein